MVNLNRRQTLALGGATFFPNFCSAAPGVGADERQADDRLQRQPAFVRSDRRTLGGQSDHPGDLSRDLRSVRRPEAGPLVHAGPPDQMGLERRQDKGLDGRARRRRLARRFAASRRTTSSGRSSAPAIRRPAIRFSSSGAVSAISDRRQSHHRRRQAVRPHGLQVDGVPDRLHPAEGLLREGRRGRVREEADRRRPLHGRRVSGQCVPAPEAQRQVLGPEGRLRDGHLQVRARRHQPRRGDRKRLRRRDARDSRTRNSTG